MDLIKDYFDSILEDFRECGSKMEQLEIVLEYAKDLPCQNNIKIPQNKVPGCTSNVYINCYMENDKVQFEATSDALIVGGYISILFDGLSNRSIDDILNNKEVVYEFAKNGGIKESLTPTRANAFANILEMMFSKVKNLKN